MSSSVAAMMALLREDLASLEPRSVTGIDISPKAIEQASDERGSLAEYEVMDAASMTFPDNRFDLVIGRAHQGSQ